MKYLGSIWNRGEGGLEMDKADLVSQISFDLLLGTLVSYVLRVEDILCYTPFKRDCMKVLNS